MQNCCVSEQLVPHAKLLKAVFGGPQYPVPARYEKEIIDAVNAVLAEKLQPRPRFILIHRFGLEGDKPKTLDETAVELSHVAGGKPLARERIRQIEIKTIRQLRHPTRSRELGRVLTIPAESVGWIFFGPLEYMLPAELSRIPFSPSNFSSAVLADLLHHPDSLEIGSLMDIMRLNLADYPLTPETFAELKRYINQQVELKREEMPREKEEKERVIFKAAEPEPPVNNLLTELALSSEQLKAVAELPLADMGAPKRAYSPLNRYRKGRITTVGELLSYTIDELGRVRMFGPWCAYEIGKALQPRLNLPQEKYPQDYLANRLSEGVGEVKIRQQGEKQRRT